MLENFEHLEIENPHFIYGGDHLNNNGIPPDTQIRSI